MNLTSPKFGSINNDGEYPSPQNYPHNVPPPILGNWTRTTPPITLPDGRVIIPITNTPIIMANTNNPNTTITNPCANTECLSGSVVVNTDGSCGCTQPNGQQPPNTTKVIDVKNGQVIYYQLPNTQTQSSNTNFDVMQFVKDNPLLIGGAILGIIFLMSKK